MGVVLGVKGQVQCSQDLAFIFYRIATPDECAGTVSFLSSDDASYVTGETIVIAGGSQSRLWKINENNITKYESKTGHFICQMNLKIDFNINIFRINGHPMTKTIKKNN